MVMEVWHRNRGFMVENWICVIDLEYVSVGGGGRMKAAQGAYGWVLWGWDKFSWCIKYKVGDITSIKFWLDIWCGETTHRVFSWLVSSCLKQWNYLQRTFAGQRWLSLLGAKFFSSYSRLEIGIPLYFLGSFVFI